jgi:hypothetical protein
MARPRLTPHLVESRVLCEAMHTPRWPQRAMAAKLAAVSCRVTDRGLPVNTPTARHCPRDAGTGNAVQYQAFVFNFRPNFGINLSQSRC